MYNNIKTHHSEFLSFDLAVSIQLDFFQFFLGPVTFTWFTLYIHGGEMVNVFGNEAVCISYAKGVNSTILLPAMGK